MSLTEKKLKKRIGGWLIEGYRMLLKGYREMVERWSKNGREMVEKWSRDGREVVESEVVAIEKITLLKYKHVYTFPKMILNKKEMRTFQAS
jgi:flavin-dependent dehydrogenase